MICPNCHHQASEEEVFCSKCGTALLSKEIISPTADSVGIGTTRTCARCGKKSSADLAACGFCKERFGAVVVHREGRRKLRTVTCLGCGESYELLLNKLVLGILVAIGIITIMFFLPLGLLFIGLAMAYGTGRFSKKCPHCRKTPLQVASRKKLEKYATSSRSKIKQERKETWLTRSVASINRFMEGIFGHINPLKWIPILSFILLIIPMFITNTLTVEFFGSGEKDLMYMDLLYNFRERMLSFVLVLLLTHLITLITSLLQRPVSHLVALGLSWLTAIGQIAVAVMNNEFDSFTITRYEYGIYIDYEAAYSCGFISFLLVISALLLAVSATLNYLIEKERTYLDAQ